MGTLEIAEKNKKPFFLKPGFLLVLLYLLSVAVRFALALLYRHGPSVTIDESLYINIEKSNKEYRGIIFGSDSSEQDEKQRVKPRTERIIALAI